MLCLQSVTFWRQNTCVIDNVSLNMPSGQMTGVIGPNGAGKSTLFHLVTGLLTPSQGQISFSGQDLIQCSATTRAHIIGWLAQKNNISWPLTVRDILKLGVVDGVPVHDDEIHAVLARLGMLFCIDRSVLALSGGEQALVMLARLLMNDAPCLLIDEPLQSLDPAHQFQVLDILREEARAGRCVLMVCHDLNLASRYCDQLALIDKGRLLIHDTTQAVIDSGFIEQSFHVHFQHFSKNERGEAFSALVAGHEKS